jgi:hypothetical protein
MLRVIVSPDHTQHTRTHACTHALGRTPLFEGSAPRRGNTQDSQETDIHAPAGFEPTISASQRPQTYALDRAATGIGFYVPTEVIFPDTKPPLLLVTQIFKLDMELLAR